MGALTAGSAQPMELWSLVMLAQQLGKLKDNQYYHACRMERAILAHQVLAPGPCG